MRSVWMTLVLLGLAANALLAQMPAKADSALVPAIEVGLPGGSHCKAEPMDGDAIAAAIKAVPHGDAYDIDKIERITATILTVGLVWVGDHPEQCVCVRMRSTDGRDRIVLAGPSDFASQAALGLRSGRVVEVTGFPAEYGTQTVLVAGSIAVEGQTAILRDAAGHAIWTKK